jgi:uncharacterized protein (TIGR02246 family)
MASTRTADEAAIRQLIADRVAAVRNKDVRTLVSHFAADVRSFDVVNPLQVSGADAIRKRLEQWLGSFRAPVDFETKDLQIALGSEVAYCHFLSGVNATMAGDTRVHMWYRTTVCYQKIEGRWFITHEHDSVPFDVDTGMASLNLTP